LPELNKANIRNAEYIANPDATPIGFITACSKGLLKTDVHINATTGSTAQESAHQKHFSWRSNNMSHYKAFDHQHLEKLTKVNQLQADYTNELIFVPNRVRNFCNFIYDNRGKPRRHPR
jgi:N-acetyl-gamma-glutamyl-phosphate reductase